MAHPSRSLLVLALALGLVGLAGPGLAAGSPAESAGVASLITPTPTATEVMDNTTDGWDTTPVPTATDGGLVATVIDGSTDDESSVSRTVDTADGLLANATDTVMVETTQETNLDVSGLSATDRSAEMIATVARSPSMRSTANPGAGRSRPPSPTAGPSGPTSTGLGPVSPFMGGAVAGGAAVLTGFAGRVLAGRSDTPTMVKGPPSEVRDTVRALGARMWDRLWPALGIFGYQRFDDSDPLEHEGRERLHELIRAEPGVHLSAVAESADLPLSTARYHLRVLEHEGLVRGVKLRGKRRFFPPDVEAEALVAALTDTATASVLRSLVREGPGSVNELADRLDRDPSTVSHHLDRLADDGLVERERKGPAVVSRAVPAVGAAIEEFDAGGSAIVQPRPAAPSD